MLAVKDVNGRDDDVGYAEEAGCVEGGCDIE